MCSVVLAVITFNHQTDSRICPTRRVLDNTAVRARVQVKLVACKKRMGCGIGPRLPETRHVMKCYFCKREIHSAVRVFVPSRKPQEKSNFRDLCRDCYSRFRSNNTSVRPLSYK